jgi:Carbohydrate esterase, sialic acid-specific acetylesterase
MKRTILALAGALFAALCCSVSHARQPAQSVNAVPVAVTPPARESFHLYLLMGQSNMVGRDTRSLASQVDNSRILSLNRENNWVVAREPIHSDARIPPGQGPGIPFAQEALKSDSKVTIGLVPCAVGGTSLSRWVKGADLYEACVARAKLAAQAGSIEGVLWHQGETDTTSQQNADTYETRLVQMFKDLRDDLGRAGLPIVVGQLGPFLEPAKYPYLDTVRAAIKHMPADLPHVAYADSAGLEDRGDKLHFSADSQKLFGVRYAKALQQAATGK